MRVKVREHHADRLGTLRGATSAALNVVASTIATAEKSSGSPQGSLATDERVRSRTRSCYDWNRRADRSLRS
jgi:hypothetical protein